MQYDSLPEWNELSQKVQNNIELDPVEQFIHDYEPAGDDADYWRANLQRALYFFGAIPVTWEFFQKWCKSHGNYDGPDKCNSKPIAGRGSDYECNKSNCPAWIEWKQERKKLG